MARQKAPILNKQCCICNAAFTTSQPNQRSCSKECRIALQRQTARERERQYARDSGARCCLDEHGQKPCLVCAKPFTPWRKGVLICSIECKAERDRQISRAERAKQREKYRQSKDMAAKQPVLAVSIPSGWRPADDPWAIIDTFPPEISGRNDIRLNPFL